MSSPFRKSEQNTISWVDYKQHTWVSHNPGGWEVQDQGSDRSSVWWEPTFWFMDGTCSSLNPSSRGALWGSLIRALILFIPSGTGHLPGEPPPTIHTLCIRFQQKSSERTQTFKSPLNLPWDGSGLRFHHSSDLLKLQLWLLGHRDTFRLLGLIPFQSPCVKCDFFPFFQCTVTSVKGHRSLWGGGEEGQWYKYARCRKVLPPGDPTSLSLVGLWVCKPAEVWA